MSGGSDKGQEFDDLLTRNIEINSLKVAEVKFHVFLYQRQTVFSLPNCPNQINVNGFSGRK